MNQEKQMTQVKDMKLLLIAMPLLFLLMAASLFFMFPVGQKLLGKSLVVTSTDGYEIIYKEKTLVYAPQSSVVQYSDDFSNIIVLYKNGLHDTFVNGKLVKDQ